MSKPIRRNTIARILLLTFFIVQSVPVLFEAWTTSPRDRLAWLAMLIWLLPVAAAWKRRTQQVRKIENLHLNAVAVILAAFGMTIEINAFYHAGLAVILIANIPWNRRAIFWLMTAISWMPILGVLFVAPTALHLFAVRIAIATLGAAIVFIPKSLSMPRPSADTTQQIQSLRLLATAIVFIAVLVFTMQSRESSRLANLPVIGDHFQSQTMPISETEKQALGNAIAIRRLYHSSGTPIIVTVVDGTLNRHAIHDLLYCIKGAGWTVTSDKQQVIPGGQARVICSRKELRQSTLIYWFSDGTTRHNSFARYLWQVSLQRLTAGQISNEPYLVILQPCNASNTNWDGCFLLKSPWFRI